MASSPDIFIPKHLRRVVLDATVFTTVEACARLMDFRYNMSLVSIDGKSNSLEAGLIFHKYAEVYYGQVAKGFQKSQAHESGLLAAQLYATGCPGCTYFIPTPEVPKPKCGHPPNEFPGVKNTPYEKEKDYQIGWRWVIDTCEQYYQFYKNDFWVPLQVEKVVGKTLYQDDEIEIHWKSKIDLISDTNVEVLPVDHKTMKQRRDNVSLNNQFIGQCLVMDTRRMIVNKVGFQTSLKPEEKFTRGVISYSAARLNEWSQTILPYWAYKYLDYKDNDYWPPNFTQCENKYGNCPFIDVCEADPNERERELQQNFIVGEIWNPTNPSIEE